jgi:hypothetical protein
MSAPCESRSKRRRRQVECLCMCHDVGGGPFHPFETCTCKGGKGMAR